MTKYDQNDNIATHKTPQTPKEALILALKLAIIAPTEQDSRNVIEMLPALIAKLTELEIDECKAMAQMQVFGPIY